MIKDIHTLLKVKRSQGRERETSFSFFFVRSSRVKALSKFKVTSICLHQTLLVVRAKFVSDRETALSYKNFVEIQT